MQPPETKNPESKDIYAPYTAITKACSFKIWFLVRLNNWATHSQKTWIYAFFKV